MKKRLIYKDKTRVAWWRYKWEDADRRTFPHDAVVYKDDQLKCYFAIYRQGRREFEACSFTDYPLAYARLQKIAVGIQLPPLEDFYLYEEFTKTYETIFTWN